MSEPEMTAAPHGVDTSWEDASTLHKEELNAFKRDLDSEDESDEDDALPSGRDNDDDQDDSDSDSSDSSDSDDSDDPNVEYRFYERKDYENEVPVCYTDNIPSLFLSSPTQRVNLLTLPNEIAEIVFLHTGPHAATALVSTCKRLHALAWARSGRLWKKFLRHHLYFGPTDFMPRSPVIALHQFSNLVCHSSQDHFGENVWPDRTSDKGLCGGCHRRVKTALARDRKEYAKKWTRLDDALRNHTLLPYQYDPLAQDFLNGRYGDGKPLKLQAVVELAWALSACFSLIAVQLIVIDSKGTEAHLLEALQP